MVRQVATPPPALKRRVHVMQRAVAIKPLAPMRVVPVGTKPPALKRVRHVCKCPEPTAAPVHDALDTQVLLDQSVDQYVEEFIAAYPF